ncbi:hypothetical protein TorRG33x02_134070, partial [Trema orientale]
GSCVCEAKGSNGYDFVVTSDVPTGDSSLNRPSSRAMAEIDFVTSSNWAKIALLGGEC